MQLHLSWSRSTTRRSPSFSSSALPGAKRFLTTISHRFAFDGILRCWALFSAACPDKLMRIWRPSLTPRPRLNITTARGEPPTSTTASCRRTAQAPTRHYCKDLYSDSFVYGTACRTTWFTARVSAFQCSLTELVRERCRAQDENWHLWLSPRRFIL